MRKFDKKSKTGKLKDIIFSVPFIVFLGIVCSLSISSTWNVYKKAKETQNNLTNITKTYDELKSRESELIKKIESLGTALGVETEIREKFGLVKEGEEMIVIVDPAVKEGKVEEATDNQTLWEKIKEWF